MHTDHPIGVLLINLGTPDSPSVPDVRRYLREFLSDRRVVDLPTPARLALLYGVILPFRPRQTAKAYQQIWTENGSPLRHYSDQFSQALQAELGSDFVVTLGMRYGNPSLAAAIDTLLARQCRQCIILPLFPQYASAATGSAVEETLRILKRAWNIPALTLLSDFHVQPGFIDSYAKQIETYYKVYQPDHLLLSYHGLPERHLEKSECKHYTTCAKENMCPKQDAHLYCYRRQCVETSRALAQKLNLKPDDYSIAFQSRLGRTPWIKPYTDHLLPDLAARGVKKLAVACPSFVTDCLETIEEIGIRGAAQWQSLGGTSLHRIPCLNAEADWVHVVKEWISTCAKQSV